jgi:arabinosyltransferase C
LSVAALILAVLSSGSVRARIGRGLMGAPVVVVLAASSVMVTMLLTAFVTAPVRQPAGSLARANLRWLTGGPKCGLAEDIQVLRDGEVFAALGPPGVADDSPAPGMTVSPWFALPSLGRNDGVAVMVSGSTAAPNRLDLEFGRRDPVRVAPIGVVTPLDRKPGGDRWWRTIGVDSSLVPSAADSVRVVASGSLVFTGPRRRTAVPMTDFLATHGPVLVSWPIAFLFPCVGNIAPVADGLAAMPRVILTSPDDSTFAAADPAIGGSFAGLKPLDRFYEVPTRLAGHTDIDWGSVLVAGSAVPGDAYDARLSGVYQTGFNSP